MPWQPAFHHGLVSVSCHAIRSESRKYRREVMYHSTGDVNLRGAISAHPTISLVWSLGGILQTLRFRFSGAKPLMTTYALRFVHRHQGHIQTSREFATVLLNCLVMPIYKGFLHVTHNEFPRFICYLPSQVSFPDYWTFSPLLGSHHLINHL